MRMCVACKYKKIHPTDNISVYSFPKNEQIRQLWIAAIGQENYKLRKSHVLCSQHFENNCFFYSMRGKTKKYIKPDAIPTIFDSYHLREKISNINKNIEEIQIVTKVTSNTVDDRDVKQSIIIKHENINNDNVNKMPSISNTDDSIENNQSHMEIIQNDSDVDNCNEREKISNINKNIEEIQIVTKVTSNIVDDRDVKQNIIIKRENINNDNVNKTPNISNTDDSMENNQSHMEIVQNYSDVDSCNERDPQMNAGLSESSHKNCQWIRYFGDCSEKDLESPYKAKRVWQIVTNTVNHQRRKILKLHQQIRRQNRKITKMQSLIVELKKKQIISNQAKNIISVRN
ncbi:THAP domain-containing protein 2 [Cyphomyrmex costatus]|uniref:THAP domain-containing protein 2 n=1 Tax=Cyphomyrmex costatus TaxID=456900 RepID=A0A195CSY8_9HYME|nr:THAP domain-containing protein 2 [Cyphomyrmex costatus]